MAQTTTAKAPIFSAPDKALEVTATGAEQLGRAGARLGQIGNEERSLDTQGAEAVDRGLLGVARGGEELGNAVQQTENQADLVNVNNAHADLIGGLQQAHDEFFANTSPTDTNAAEDYKEQVLGPAIDQLRDSATTKVGQQHANDLADTLEIHYGNMADQTQSKRLASSFSNTIDNQAQPLTAAIVKNPDNLPLALSSFDNQIRTMSATTDLNPEAVAQARQRYRQEMIGQAGKAIVDNAVTSGQTPNLSQFTAAYGKDLGDEGVQALTAYQNFQIKAKSADDTAAQGAQKQQFATNSSAIGASIFDNLGNMDAAKTPSPNFLSKIVARSAMAGGDMANDDVQAVIGAYRKMTGPDDPPSTNPTTMDGLLTGLASQTGRPTPATVINQYASGRLSYDDAAWAVKQAQQPPSAGLQQLTQNLATARSSLVSDVGSGAVNPAGMAAYQRFQSYAVNAYKQGDPIEPKQLPNIVETFQPTGQDALSHVPVLPDRPSLNDIFGGR